MNKIYDWIDSIWVWIAGKVFVRFEFDLPVEQLKSRQADGRILFTLTHGGLVEWLILSSWCRTVGLGAILVCNRKRVLFLSKPLYFLQILFRQRQYSDLFLLAKESGPRLAFVPASERKKPFDPTPVEKLLGGVFSDLILNPGTKWECFPLLFLWRKYARGPTRHLFEFALGLSSSPNIVGKIWYLARRRMDSTVRSLKSFHLSKEGSGSELVDGINEEEPVRLAKQVRRRILVQTNQEMRIVLGPRYLSPHSVKETLLRNPDIQKAIEAEALAEGVDRKKVMLRAYRYLDEIVANYQFRFVEVMYVVLTWLFTKIFDGINSRDEELQAVRELMKTKPVVFVSCHRSHLDYMVLPYILFLQDMVPPHVAAGVNLSFWPVGHFLRMGGAFFIRRSFRGNKLYSLCLRKYIEYLLTNRHNVKFFIEGTRSRTGKMLPPAYGILKMVLESYQQHGLDDIALVPVSLCYDEVLEQGSYTKEITGGQKTKESAGSLLESRKLVRRNIGKVYVRFAPALLAKEVVHTAEAAQLDPTLMLQKTAFQICKSINDVTPITPKALVCCVILGDRLASVTLEEILRLATMLATYVKWTGASLSIEPSGEGFRRAVEQTVRRMQKSGVLSITEMVPRTFFCDNRRRLLINFYKNNGIHRLVTPSILMLSFFSALRDSTHKEAAPIFLERMRQTAIWIRNILKFEFFFSPTPQFLEEMDANIEYFFVAHASQEIDVEGLIKCLGEHFAEWDDVSVYIRLLGDLLESYLVLLLFLEAVGESTHEKKGLIQKVVRFAESKNVLAGISFPESISIQNYSNGLQLLENMKLVKFEKNEEKTNVIVAAPGERSRALQKEISGLLELMQENPEVFINPQTRWLLNK